MGLILWMLIGGLIIGVIGKAVAPGDRGRVPLWLTVVCGIAGILIGNALYGVFFNSNTPGIDWWRHAWQVAVAAGAVSAVAGRNGRSRRRI
jgi:uncharacterized membrane protein YeaQ/YmgE (transglycosylase-associated protein family)